MVRYMKSSHLEFIYFFISILYNLPINCSLKTSASYALLDTDFKNKIARYKNKRIGNGQDSVATRTNIQTLEPNWK